MKIKRGQWMFVVALFLATVAVPLTLQGSYAENVSGKSQTLKGEHIGDANVFDLKEGGIKISKGKNEKNEEQIVIERYGDSGNVMPVYLPKGTTIVVYSGTGGHAKYGIEVEPNVGEVNIQFGAKKGILYWTTEISTSNDECPFKIGAGNKVKVTTKGTVSIYSENASGIYSEGELILDVDDEEWKIKSRKRDNILREAFGIYSDKLTITSSKVTSSGYSYGIDIAGSDGAIKVADVDNNIILPDSSKVCDKSRPNAIYTVCIDEYNFDSLDRKMSREELINRLFYKDGKCKWYGLRLKMTSNL